MSDMNSKIKEELEEITPRVKKGIAEAKKTCQYSKIIRNIIFEYADLLTHCNSLKETGLKEIFENYFEIDKKLSKKVAHNTKDWFDKNQGFITEIIKKLNSLDEQIESTRDSEIECGGVNDNIEKSSEENPLNIEDSQSKNENKKISGEIIKETATDTQNVVSLSEDITETISKLNEEIKEKDMELSDKDSEIENLKNENLALKNTLEAKVSNLEDNNEYKILLEVRTALKLQDDVKEKMIPLELEASIIEGVKAFVTKYAILDVNDINFGTPLPQSKLVKAALITILKKNNFL
ncbi:hypothetical protein [uncultured Clostridium sp.]|jgi:hypothetical protein|uniref:hypothetical protein n=1 Tax=uncultured Clostridium sp. TaxID=59620 RepID=UPI00262B2F7E|nr:hypothetical protein [uncultured Clostridium sp.]